MVLSQLLSIRKKMYLNPYFYSMYRNQSEITDLSVKGKTKNLQDKTQETVFITLVSKGSLT